MKNINQKDYELIKDLYHWKIDTNDFKKKTDFKANFQELRSLLYSVKDCIDEDGYNQFFNSILWELPKRLSEKDYEKGIVDVFEVLSKKLIRIIQINKHRVDDTVFITVNIEESIINISDIVAALTALKTVEQVKNSQLRLDIGKY